MKAGQGFVAAFYACGILTLWGVVGELITLTGLVEVLRLGNAITPQVQVVFGGLLWIAAALALVYVFQALGETVREQTDAGSQTNQKAVLYNQMRALGVLPKDVPEATGVKAPLRSWSLL